MALDGQVDLDCKPLAVTGWQNGAKHCLARRPVALALPKTSAPYPRPASPVDRGGRARRGRRARIRAYRGPFSLPYTRTFPAVTLCVSRASRGRVAHRGRPVSENRRRNELSTLSRDDLAFRWSIHFGLSFLRAFFP